MTDPRVKMPAARMWAAAAAFVVTIAAWVLSYAPSAESHAIDGDDSGLIVHSYHGKISVGWIHYNKEGDEFQIHRFAGFVLWHGFLGWQVAVPYWAIAVICCYFSLLFIRSYRAIAHRVRAENIYCKTCGYDLRASPDFCPECGTPRSGRKIEPYPGQHVWAEHKK